MVVAVWAGTRRSRGLAGRANALGTGASVVDRDASREAVAELDLAGVAGRRAARPGRLALGSGQAPPAVTVEQPY